MVLRKIPRAYDSKFVQCTECFAAISLGLCC
jgi:hypothetical protein